jgi:carbamoyl-phosphate synthase small subunit
LRGQSSKNISKNAILVLEDGTSFEGYGFGAKRKVSGEVVFSTSMVGYPEALTDPSYQGQILTFTYPLVGNYGVPAKENDYGVFRYFESEKIRVSGILIHELCEKPHHWASVKTLNDWLEEEKIPGIFGIDTRKLTKKLRTKGVMLGVMEVWDNEEEHNFEKLKKEIRKIVDPNLRDLVGEVTVEEPINYRGIGSLRKHVALIDCGVKHGILRNLVKRGIDITRVPYDFSANEILEYDPDGIVISNGPGDPKVCDATIETISELIDEKIPIMGVCLGNQILALAFEGDTYKLRYGHRSQNQPVLDLRTNRCYITTQNHGYSVRPSSLEESDLELRFVNANDQTNEGIEHNKKAIFGFQWHPEASPGPYDTEFLFDEFLRVMKV